MKRRGPLIRVSIEINPAWWDVRFWRQKNWGFLAQFLFLIVEYIPSD